MDDVMFREARTTESLNHGTHNNNHSKYKLLNTKEAAEFLGITKYTLAHWLSTKRYPGLNSIKLGGARRFREEDHIDRPALNRPCSRSRGSFL
ncbi:MAG: helix-turn-helix domain-containing protein, partial [Puniceicoccales bacterium]|nr:helix-turn-helix domain-containing protein [Puniceicoccales bacterium]